ncbi:hypothetical protein SAMN02745857_00126 [Andreprevotia lacus DSM 23236]|jgi:hypothetical protein|uniref:Uncharacterized protein n=1 Tax=Andreprevotia lacus DSM 23236 TaxID=1121001 RepID=A0A1W1WWU8_9NEIS|nr:hypothetical protein SAMN02745857_00126 [Andreprevotia lacus DSM 23236]
MAPFLFACAMPRVRRSACYRQKHLAIRESTADKTATKALFKQDFYANPLSPVKTPSIPASRHALRAPQ